MDLAYIKAFQRKQPGMTRVAIERSILRAWKAEWSEPGKSPYGNSFTDHYCAYVNETCPKTDCHEDFVRMVGGFEKTVFILKRKILNLIGGKSTGKTDFSATFALTMLSIWPEFTAVYVAAPYMSAADSTVWGRIQTRFAQMEKANGHLWPGMHHNKSKNRIVFETHAETGFVELRTLDKIGKLQGTKSYDPDKGWLILLCDEIALFPSRALMDLLDNLTGNANFACVTGCNFKNTEGLEGDLCRPEGGEFTDLNIDEDQEWLSSYKSYTVRLDGHRSPNVLAGKVKYRYLLTEQIRQDMEDIHGLNGLKYLEQIRSFPNNSMADFFVTSMEKIRAGGGWDEFVFDKGRETRVAACDPGFGGDPCKIGVFEFSNCRVQDSEGKFHTVELFMPIAPIETIKLDVGKIADQDWMDRLHHQTKGALFVREGQEVTLEQQIAVKAGEFIDQWGVRRNHFVFDGSMRAGISTEMIKVLGNLVTGLDFGSPPSKRMDLSGRKEAREMYSNLVTEMYFNFASIVQSGQFRGADKIKLALKQVCGRMWKSGRNDVKSIETKELYKKTHQGYSPDDADVLVMGLEAAIRAGFMEVPRSRPGGEGGINKIRQMIASSPRFIKKTIKKLNA